ncbi:unnamed protein product [Bursaphelenchus xylophilus]|uniref:(pine wood nematode) hypothetical protein n=1 Tax=Bursaphelenchus xylophilus TaxID=6326 RepID=A0A7I8WFQ5_BURXY|nr:unnamed protein product [Bursaphelenchus xylophilus]CAG9111935.1 unnamed protein product [Bursaphelenchus xylophilus]
MSRLDAIAPQIARRGLREATAAATAFNRSLRLATKPERTPQSTEPRIWKERKIIVGKSQPERAVGRQRVWTIGIHRVCWPGWKKYLILATTKVLRELRPSLGTKVRKNAST